MNPAKTNELIYSSVDKHSSRSNRKSRKFGVTSEKNEYSHSTPNSSFLKDVSFTTNSFDEVFIPATQFFSNVDSREKLSDWSNGDSDTRSKLRESTRRLSIRKPLNDYIAYSSDEELEEWWHQSKTGYTYSDSPSYRERVTPERRIGSPNMSRRGLKGAAIGQVASPQFSQTWKDTSSNYSVDNMSEHMLELRSRGVERKSLYNLSDSSDEDIPLSSRNFVQEETSSRKTRSSVIQSTTTTSKLHYGFDNDDELSNQPKNKRYASPLVRQRNPSPRDLVPEVPILPQNGTLGNSRTVFSTASSANSYASNSYTTTTDQNTWKATFTRWRHSTYTYCVVITTTVLMNIIGATRSLSKKLPIFINGSDRRKTFQGQNQFKDHYKIRTNTVITTTTWATQGIQSLANGCVDWYSSKKKKNPCLWTWFPILLLLLFIPLCAYWWQSPVKPTVSTFPEGTYSQSHFLLDWKATGNFIYEKLASFGICLKNIFWYLCSSVKQIVIWPFRTLFSSVSHDSNGNIENVPMYNSNVRKPKEQKYILEAIYSSSQSVWIHGVRMVTFLANGIVSLIGAATSFLYWLWFHFCQVLYWIGSEAMWRATDFLSSVTHFGSAITSGAMKVIWFVPSLFVTSRTVTLPPTVISSSDTNEQILDYILNSKKLTSVILSHLESQKVGTGPSEDIMDRFALKSEIYEMKAQLLKSQIQLEESQKAGADVSAIKEKQVEFLNRFEELGLSLRQLTDIMENNQEKHAMGNLDLQNVVSSIKRNILDLNEKYVGLKIEQQSLSAQLTKCCKKSYLTMEDLDYHMTRFLSDVLGMPADEKSSPTLTSIHTWLKDSFVAKEEVEDKFGSLEQRIDAGERSNKIWQEEMLQHTKNNFTAAVLQTIESLNIHSNSNYHSQSTMTYLPDSSNKSEIEAVVRRLLNKYDADRTGMVDHALESAGGSVISTRCTEGYDKHFAYFYLLGLRIPFVTYTTNTPRSMIQASRNPGECWAFKGTQGYALIQLAGPVLLTGFTMEHIPKSLSPQDSIDSAPQNFSVYGMYSEKDPGVSLGNYTFLDNEEPIQYFPIRSNINKYFPYVELKIDSNHGNVRYTCVYRFRVHGKRQQ